MIYVFSRNVLYIVVMREWFTGRERNGFTLQYILLTYLNSLHCNPHRYATINEVIKFRFRLDFRVFFMWTGQNFIALLLFIFRSFPLFRTFLKR